MQKEKRQKRGGIVDSDSKEERRKKNKKLWMGERASERQRDYDKRTFFYRKRKTYAT